MPHGCRRVYDVKHEAGRTTKTCLNLQKKYVPKAQFSEEEELQSPLIILYRQILVIFIFFLWFTVFSHYILTDKNWIIHKLPHGFLLFLSFWFKIYSFSHTWCKRLGKTTVTTGQFAVLRRCLSPTFIAKSWNLQNTEAIAGASAIFPTLDSLK